GPGGAEGGGGAGTRLPGRAAQPAPVRWRPARPAGARDAEARVNGEQPERVLVADDEPDMAESCGFLLERQGYAVRTANTGERALEPMAGQPVALGVSDVPVPRMSGLPLPAASH